MLCSAAQPMSIVLPPPSMALPPPSMALPPPSMELPPPSMAPPDDINLVTVLHLVQLIARLNIKMADH